MKILVTGADGQVGRELRFLSSTSTVFDFTFVNKSGLDIINKTQIDLLFDTLQPDVCINCAAYTAVDKAESDRDLCFKVNADGPAYLAKACTRLGSRFVHLSTDYVYNLDTDVPLTESDQLSPKGIYAESKLAGEQQAMQHCDSTLIIRTSWVYSSYGQNFVKTMLKLGKEREMLAIVADQIGTPTYGRDIAQTILHIIPQLNGSNFGIYNFSNTGQTNWADFAKSIYKIKAIDCKVEHTSTKAYNAAAHRPLWSVLSMNKINSVFGVKPRQWEDGLQECLELL